jgi:hypothetical protein
MSSSVTVRPVEGWWDRRKFIDVPYEFYPGRYPRWVPPLRRDAKSTLDSSSNAFFEHGEMQLFLAEDASGAAVGRVAGIVNGMHLQKYDDATGFFGFFECVEEYEVAEALLDAAADWLRDQGLERMRGPANPSLNDTAGLLVDGFSFHPSVLMPYNPPYHEDFLLRYGFDRIMTMWSFYAHVKYAKTDRLRRGTDIARRRTPGLTLRTLDMDRLQEEVRVVREIYNEAWSDNWGHVPMTEPNSNSSSTSSNRLSIPTWCSSSSTRKRRWRSPSPSPTSTRPSATCQTGACFRSGCRSCSSTPPTASTTSACPSWGCARTIRGRASMPC